MLVSQYLRDAATLNETKHLAYGDSHERFSRVMLSLFPRGITLKTEEDHKRYGLLMSIAVKLTRYSVGWDQTTNPDHARDMQVYAAMLEATDDHRSRDGRCMDQRPEGDAPYTSQSLILDTLLAGSGRTEGR